jgi:osmoprotectant transport system ATP-binding protein
VTDESASVDAAGTPPPARHGAGAGGRSAPGGGPTPGDRGIAEAVSIPGDGGDAEAPEAAIRLEGLTKTYPGAVRPAVDALDLSIPRGELVALVGPSGCGKTTTLKMINRLVEPTGGVVWLEGTDIRTLPVHEVRRGIGYVIQQAGLFPHRKVRDNIATVPHLLGWSRARIDARVAELAELLDLDPLLLRRYPAALSGGQQQRVGVARALAADPPVLLMDEPYSAVDPIVRARLQDELLALQRRMHKTIVLVTHDIDEAIKLADRIVILGAGGHVAQQGTPTELLRAPADDFVADFLGNDRGIKRLSLVQVGETKLATGPVVAVDARADEARAVMAAEGTDWVAVCDGDRLLGWVDGDEITTATSLGQLRPRPFAAVVHPGTTLKAALDVIVTSRTRVAVVVSEGGADGGADTSSGDAGPEGERRGPLTVAGAAGSGRRYLGMLTVDDLAEGITP